MLTPVWSGRFKRDVRRAQKRGKDMDKLKAALSLLIEQAPLPANYNDHPLRGDWRGFRDLHIEPDWLLLYPSTTMSCSLPVPAQMPICSMDDQSSDHAGAARAGKGGN